MIINNLLSLICFSFACLGAVVAALLVGLFLLQKKVRENAATTEKITVDAAPPADADTRWAHADLVPAAPRPLSPEPTKVCPACGAKNQENTPTCAYCGRTL